MLEEILNHQISSKNFDNDYQKLKPKKKYIPPMNHPWRKNMFKMFIKTYTNKTELLA